MPSADFSHAVRVDRSTLSQFQSHATSQGTCEISRGKTQNLLRVNAGFIKHAQSRIEGFAVTCPLALNVPHLLSGSCSSPRAFGLDFLQTPPHGDAPDSRDLRLALFLAFGSANTWREDLHLTSSVPCPAHTKKSAAAFTPSAGVIRYARSLDSRIASNISFRVMPFRKPGTSKGERRRGDFGAMENISPLRRRITTSSLLDSSRISANFSRA